jgi:hypothetical protein
MQGNKSMNLSPTVQYPKKLTEQKDPYFSSIFSFTFTMKANKSIDKAKAIRSNKKNLFSKSNCRLNKL